MSTGYTANKNSLVSIIILSYTVLQYFIGMMSYQCWYYRLIGRLIIIISVDCIAMRDKYIKRSEEISGIYK